MMRAVASLSGAFWTLALGAVALFAFFVVIGGVSPGDTLLLTGVVVVLAVLSAIHFLRVRRAVRGNPSAARSVHAMRERRGF